MNSYVKSVRMYGVNSVEWILVCLLIFFFFFFFLLTIFFTKWFYFINWLVMLHSRKCNEGDSIFSFYLHALKLGSNKKKLILWHIRGNQQCVVFYFVINIHLVIFYLLFVCPMAELGPSSRWQMLVTWLNRC